MTAPSPTEQATLDRFEAALDAEESLRERVARAIYDVDPDWTLHGTEVPWDRLVREWQDHHRELADAAIAAMRPARAAALTATPNHGRNAT